MSYRDRQSLETKRQEEDETRKNTLPIPTDSPTDLEENRSPPTSTLKGAIERPAPQNREEPPHIRNLIERHTEQRRRERQERSPSVDSVNVNKILQFAQTGKLNADRTIRQIPNVGVIIASKPKEASSCKSATCFVSATMAEKMFKIALKEHLCCY